MSSKRNNMPRLSFAPDSEKTSRAITLDEPMWAMLDKYCSFVEKKTGYRPTYDKVIGKLLNDLFGIDKAFRHNEGLVRAKKLSGKSKPEEVKTVASIEPVKASVEPANEAKQSPAQPTLAMNNAQYRNTVPPQTPTRVAQPERVAGERNAITSPPSTHQPKPAGTTAQRLPGVDGSRSREPM